MSGRKVSRRLRFLQSPIEVEWRSAMLALPTVCAESILDYPLTALNYLIDTVNLLHRIALF